MNNTTSINTRSESQYQWFSNIKRECFKDNVSHSNIVGAKYNEASAWCPRTFDGFACWDDTPALTTAFQPCPKFVFGFDPGRNAYKECTEGGTWFVNPDGHNPWTNYTTCVDMEDLRFRTFVNNIYVVGYALSVVALVISIMIFLFFRTLDCTRLRIHVHLFASLAVSNSLWIVWYRTVVNDVVVVQENMAWCQVLHIINTYFMVSSYMWMFCEGLHLHLALVIVFVRDLVEMRWFIGIGWCFSMVLVVTYSIVRFYVYGDTERCWMDQSDASWIIIGPVTLSLLGSLVFLVNVVLIVLKKLRLAPHLHPTVAVMKAVRASVILIPLFGLHFLILPLQPSPESPWEKPYQVISAFVTGFQGLCVAILYCFTNHDVKTATKAYISRVRRAHEDFPMTGTTGGDSLNTRDHV